MNALARRGPKEKPKEAPKGQRDLELYDREERQLIAKLWRLTLESYDADPSDLPVLFREYLRTLEGLRGLRYRLGRGEEEDPPMPVAFYGLPLPEDFEGMDDLLPVPFRQALSG